MAVKIQGDDDPDEARAVIHSEYAMQRLANQAESPHILRARSASLRKVTIPPSHSIGLSYLYLDWAPYGSLYDLVVEASRAAPGSER
jgi:hypothetical protein